ncbi:SusC/RagA family TonB-linked outer membrane protein [Neolewinella antarctica]|uniref:TonB-linked SusC/RagA family outer membrane protein n=1 Tax=Neolewinella antarctica TaxID=442734 RepID=A0ABX0X760_9BACT|nr:TonB-dependent receptor [Neolewinella antarctica]NJC25065.1 TonB-linked SusC/RagA family outer membrane protein [Neolewinella antarctica]
MQKRLLIFFAFFTLLCTCVRAQTTISGTVTDGTDALIGVSVRAIGTTSGTITDIDGKYSLSVPEGTEALGFTYLGYREIKEQIAGRTQVDILMSEATETLNEVVVVGYGIQQKSDLTGAVAVVDAQELMDIPTQNLGQALQGKVSGLQIIPTSGAPGAGAIFRIRGVGTFGDASPLFVVDGMILSDIDFINPADVANVSVLKDASATAIYGARGANGVLIITTKQGTGGGDGQVSVSAYTGTQEVSRRLDLLNATEYATIVNEIDANSGRAPRYADPESLGEGTDWQDLIFQTAPISSVQLSFQGGGDKGGFNLSTNYFSQQGIIDGSGFDRLTVRLNTSRSIKSWLRVGLNSSFIYSKSDNQNAGGILQGAYRADPITEPRDSLGNFGDTSLRGNSGNPLATQFYNYNKGQDYRGVGSAYLEADFLKHFTFRSNFGLDFSAGFNRRFSPVFFVSAAQQNEINDLNLTSSYQRNWLWENTVDYSNDFGLHHVDGLVGITYQDQFGEFVSGGRQRIQGSDPSLLYLGLGDQMTATNGNGINGGTFGVESFLGRVNYNYDGRYLLTVSARSDGSSRFGANFRRGFFPSVGLGWNISREGFWDGGELFSRMKIRSSYGVTGNDRIGQDRFTALVNSGLNAVFGSDEALNIGQTLQALANPNLRWEETTQFDFGIEMGFLSNRLLVDVDFFDKVTDGLLYRAPIPDYIGATEPFQNIAKVVNRGVELNINWRETAGKFSYSIGGNATFLDNEILSIDGEGGEFFDGGFGIGGVNSTRGVKGYPIGGFYGYELDGVFQNEDELGTFPQLGQQVIGDLRFRDRNGDGEVTAADRTLLGSPIPDLIIGVNGSIRYAGVDLNFGLTGQFGNEILNAKRASRFGTYNQETFFLDRFNGEGSSNTGPLATLAGQNVETVSSRYIESGNYIRLRSLQLGYTLPADISQKIRMQRFRVYVNGTNLLTSQEYSGYNPEVYPGGQFSSGIDRGTLYPVSRIVTFGLDASF